jgi:hypothetical protein
MDSSAHARDRRKEQSNVHRLRSTFALAAIVLLSAIPTPSPAQLFVNIAAPPLLPTYTQPPVTAANEIWVPGYWAYGQNGYYWVPGYWATPPATGLVYTPGYWGDASNGFTWNQGYWGQNVGYYGGVNYGAGYYGNGYVGGQWAGPVYRYNTAVTNVAPAVIRNVYVNRTFVVRNVTRVSYYGGVHGLRIGPTPAQVALFRERRIAITAAQREHIVEAARDRNLLLAVNRGRPDVVVVQHPLSAANRPPNFTPETAHGASSAAAAPAHNANAAAAPVHHAAAPAPVHHAAAAPPPVHHAAAAPPPVHHAAAAPPPVHHAAAAPPPVHHAAAAPPPAHHAPAPAAHAPPAAHPAPAAHAPAAPAAPAKPDNQGKP